MALPTTPVTLTVEQVDQLNRVLSKKRHEVNNDLAVIGSALELMRMNPAQSAKMLAMIAQRLPNIKTHLSEFSEDFEKTMGITRPAMSPTTAASAGFLS